ncbi:MAG: helix-turn-helix transcriptional regulator [Bacteroidetes bacterium]|jgi:putative transcriptional regulator|nr:helix-turn-helix transcriptional regulator [Bacteroidota bacterium]MBK9300937.1 helix-turn-helix transcriptional regulator [Bacteroidota bacterium]
MSQPIDDKQKQQLIKLGERVKSIRQNKQLTLEQVSFKIGKDRQSIHKLEKGVFNPSYLYLLEVCIGLEINIKELMDF